MSDASDGREQACEGRSADGASPEPMRAWERILAFALGMATGGAGVWAVFTSGNQAGTAVLLALAAALLLISIQGTPLRGFGSGSNRIDFDRRHRVNAALKVAEREENPDVAEGIVRAATIIEPDLVVNPIGLNTYVAASWYEQDVRRAMERVTGNARADPGDRSVDMVALSEDGRSLPVIVKYRSHGRALTLREVIENVAMARYGGFSGGLLVVTNGRLLRQVEEYNSEQSPQNPPVEVVAWNGPEDDDLLSRAFGRLARMPRLAPPRARPESAD